VAPSRMVCVSASVNLPLHHKVQKFSSGTGLPGWSRKKSRKKTFKHTSHPLVSCMQLLTLTSWVAVIGKHVIYWSYDFIHSLSNAINFTLNMNLSNKTTRKKQNTLMHTNQNQ